MVDYVVLIEKIFFILNKQAKDFVLSRSYPNTYPATQSKVLSHHRLRPSWKMAPLKIEWTNDQDRVTCRTLQ